MPRVVLIGPPGSGKSTVGRSLAKLLGCENIDTDALIEKRLGKKISEIFVDDGEPFFRKIEAEEVLKALELENGVISLGGGSVLDASVSSSLHNSQVPVVYLHVSLSQAAPRVGFNKERPLLLVNPRQQWLALMESREPIYSSLATFSVSTDNKKPAAVASEIAGLLGVHHE